MKYTALVVYEDNGEYIQCLETCDTDNLPKGDVLIRVLYSSLNYKDMLVMNGNKRITHNYPHTPGIDAAGVIVHSIHADFACDDEVVVIGHDLGMNTAGGLAEYISVPASWVVKLPHGFSARDAMIYGTAGFTAAQSLFYQQSHAHVSGKRCIISGASGGVGSIAVALYAHAGYIVDAITGKESAHALLHELGAQSVITRQNFLDRVDKPLYSAQWDLGFDTVGGDVLSIMLRCVEQESIVCSCGHVGGAQLQVSMMPFIVRGIILYGVNSVTIDRALRVMIWDMIIHMHAQYGMSDALCTEIGLSEVIATIDKFKTGLVTGRIIVRIFD